MSLPQMASSFTRVSTLSTSGLPLAGRTVQRRRRGGPAERGQGRLHSAPCPLFRLLAGRGPNTGIRAPTSRVRNARITTARARLLVALPSVQLRHYYTDNQRRGARGPLAPPLSLSFSYLSLTIDTRMGQRSSTPRRCPNVGPTPPQAEPQSHSPLCHRAICRSSSRFAIRAS